MIGIGTLAPPSKLTVNGAIALSEQASSQASAATHGGYGQLWVKTATPNELWFTDDAGNDFGPIGRMGNSSSDGFWESSLFSHSALTTYSDKEAHNLSWLPTHWQIFWKNTTSGSLHGYPGGTIIGGDGLRHQAAPITHFFNSTYWYWNTPYYVPLISPHDDNDDNLHETFSDLQASNSTDWKFFVRAWR
jgi:hypothetical protein